MKRTIIASGFILATCIFTSCGNAEKAPNTEHTTEQAPAAEHQEHREGDTHHHAHYKCPKDCEKGKTYEQEGNCPVCGAKLEKIGHADHGSHEHAGHDHHEGDGHKH